MVKSAFINLCFWSKLQISHLFQVAWHLWGNNLDISTKIAGNSDQSAGVDPYSLSISIGVVKPSNYQNAHSSHEIHPVAFAFGCRYQVNHSDLRTPTGTSQILSTSSCEAHIVRFTSNWDQSTPWLYQQQISFYLTEYSPAPRVGHIP